MLELLPTLDTPTRADVALPEVFVIPDGSRERRTLGPFRDVFGG